MDNVAEAKNKHQQLILVFCLFLSLALHSFIFWGPFDLGNFFYQKPLKMNKTFNVTLHKNQKTELPKNLLTTPSNIAKSDNIPEVVKNAETVSAIEQKETKQLTPQLKPTFQSKTNSDKISVESLRESISKNEFIDEFNKVAVKPDFIIFDPRLRNNLRAIEEKQKATDLIEAENQFRKDNEYFEYQNMNGQRIVRINGNCSMVPGKEPFAITQSIWIPMGSCESQKKLVIKPGLFSYKYKAEEDDRYDKNKE